MKRLLILGLMALAVGSYAYFFILLPEKEKDSGANDQFMVSTEDIEKIQISTPESLIVLKKVGDLWFVEKPHSYLANQEMMDRTFQAMANSPVRESFPYDKKTFEFTTANSFYFELNTGEVIRLAVGSMKAPQSMLYLLNMDSQIIYLVPNIWAQLLYYPKSSLYHPYLPIPGQQVMSLRYKKGGKIIWDVRSTGPKSVELQLAGKKHEVSKAKLLWFFKQLREFELEGHQFGARDPSWNQSSLEVETDKGNIIFHFDLEKNQIFIPKASVIADYKGYALNSLTVELEKVVKNDQK